jgi:hypothetical protein
VVVRGYEGDVALGGSGAATFATMRAGDRVEVEIAVRNTDPRGAGTGPGGVTELSSIAYRLVDLRTHQSVQSGTARLLRGAPAPPTGLATSSHSDLSITETTWGAGWDALNVGLGDEAVHQPATDDGGPLSGSPTRVQPSSSTPLTPKVWSSGSPLSTPGLGTR